MRRITLWLLSTIAAVVLLFSYRTSAIGVAGASGTGTDSGGTATGSTSSDSSGSTGSDSGDAGSDSGDAGSDSGDAGSDSGDAGTGSGSGSTSDSSGSYTGSVSQTRWGPVQVSITVENGEIVSVEAVQVPNSNHRDIEINNYAVPILNQEVVDAQSADIDTVSGATVTSDGYRESLQAAIDAAQLG